MRQFFTAIRNLWNDPKGHAILVLGFYAIFFGIIFLYIFFASQFKKAEPLDEFDRLKRMSSYSYQLDINGETIIGDVSNQENSFTYHNQKYDFNNLDETDFPFTEAMKYTNNLILYNAIYNLEEYSKTTYQDGSISKVYNLNDEEITIYEKENTIYQLKVKTLEYEYIINYSDVML